MSRPRRQRHRCRADVEVEEAVKGEAGVAAGSAIVAQEVRRRVEGARDDEEAVAQLLGACPVKTLGQVRFERVSLSP